MREGKWQIMIHGESYKPIVAEAARKSATEVYNRIMVTHLLMDKARLEDALVTTERYGPGFRVLLADYTAGWIAELFSVPAARQMIEEARKLADYVIIDSPPLNLVSDRAHQDQSHHRARGAAGRERGSTGRLRGGRGAATTPQRIKLLPDHRDLSTKELRPGS